MASFFKGSCFIFWITWLLCLSYWLGTERFSQSHVINDDAMMKSLYMMYVILGLNSVFGFMGCLFLKCNVNNICCVILYAIPVGLVIPIMAGLGAYNVAKNHKNPSDSQVLKLVKSHFETSKFKTFPKWLIETERDYKCCGIRGPDDYRKLIFGKEKCQKIKIDVPCSCCAHAQGADVEEGDLAVSENFDFCMTVKKTSRCRDEKGKRDWLSSVFVNSDNPDSPAPLSLQEKCSSAKKNFLIDSKLKRNPNGTGVMHATPCYKILMGNYSMMKTCQLTFFIMFAICPFLMFVAYIRFFCKSSAITGQRSDYSLDVETISLIETPFSDPLPYISKRELI